MSGKTIMRTSHHNHAVAERRHLKALIRRCVGEIRFHRECRGHGMPRAAANEARELDRLAELRAARKAVR